MIITKMIIALIKNIKMTETIIITTIKQQNYKWFKLVTNSAEDIRMYTDNFRFERWLYFEVLQFLPVDIAKEQVILDLTFFTRRLTAAKSGIRCLCQQLHTTKMEIRHQHITQDTD